MLLYRSGNSFSMHDGIVVHDIGVAGNSFSIMTELNRLREERRRLGC